MTALALVMVAFAALATTARGVAVGGWGAVFCLSVAALYGWVGVDLLLFTLRLRRLRRQAERWQP